MTGHDDPSPRRLLDVALEAAEAGGRRAMRWFRADPATERKADGSPVTVADRESEEVLRGIIRRAFPDHGIVGEEGGETRGAAPYRWLVDPIDGTESFVRGVPLWGVLVAIEKDGEVLAGVCHMPAIGETVAAARGDGCRLNGRICRVSGVTDLAQACVVGTSSRSSRWRSPHWTTLEDRVRKVRGWSDCYAYALVATGRADVALDPTMNPWDSGPFLPILEEAGGRFTDWTGRRTVHGGDAVATNGALHDAVLAVLRGSPSV